MAYLGNLLVVGAFACSCISLLMYFLVWRGKNSLTGLARKSFIAVTALTVLALGDLLYLILVNDFSVAYVYSYSSTDLPLGYLIASLWGGQEGTFLLWVCFTSILGLIMMRSAGKFEFGNMFFLNLFIISILLIILKKGPFELLPVFREEGAGLNPLLQNFWMQIHPPIMFVGFSAAVFPFCFAMTALVERKFRTWAESARRWTMFAWITLGTSLVMGGYWAYETLGWGGFWAWDPVENSSFIPWIFLTVQVHSLFIKRRQSGLLRFSLFIVMLSFWSVLYGTFLTRSGVLADFSVHSFVDLGLNNYLVGGLIFFVSLGTIFLALRWQDIRPEPSFSKVNSRSYLVTLGILILFLGGVLVLLGTSAPLLTRMTDTPSNVGLPYYFATMTPIAVSILLLLAMFPAFRWEGGVNRPKLLWSAGIIALFTMTILLLTQITAEPIYLLLFGFATAAIFVNGFAALATWRSGELKAGYLAHIGLSLTMIGAAASAGFESKKTLTLIQNHPASGLDCELMFTSVTDTPKGYDCHVTVTTEDETFEAVLVHEFPSNAEGVMRKPHVEQFFAYDLYLAPLAMEKSADGDMGEMVLTKGGHQNLDKYVVTFIDFDLDSHGEEGEPSKATANLEITYEGKTESVRPYLQVTDEGVHPVDASFDSEAGRVFISGVNPDEGSVTLGFVGDFLSPPQEASAVLVLELSKKPLINFFWLGTLMIFVSGGLSMRAARKRRRSQIVSVDVPEKEIPEHIS